MKFFVIVLEAASPHLGQSPRSKPAVVKAFLRYLASHRQCDCEQRQGDGDQERLDGDSPRLPPYLPQHCFVFDLLYMPRQIARPARREPDSGSVMPLKVSNSRDPKKHEQWQPPETVRTGGMQYNENDERDN